VPQVTQLIFTAGRVKSNVLLAQAEHDEVLTQCRKIIQTAFTEVSDALIAHRRWADGAAARC
jgi:outer membrane protein, multidrug efflux system